MVADLAIIIASLRRTINHHDSWTHRLPPKILATVTSHLGDDAALVAATHVCHFWRTVLLSSPHLWSFLHLTNEERALVYLERSKSVPLCVSLMGLGDPSEIVRELLKKITSRLDMLQASHDSFLDELLDQPMPKLEALEIVDSETVDFDELPPKKPTHLPSLVSLVIHGIDPLRFYTPILTSFHLTHEPSSGSMGWKASILLNFLRNCPLLEVVSLSCDMDHDSNEVVSLPLLHSFTHKSRRKEYQLWPLDRLSLPSTCRVALVIDVTRHRSTPWIRALPFPRDSPYISDIRTIKISAHSRNPEADGVHITFRTELVQSLMIRYRIIVNTPPFSHL